MFETQGLHIASLDNRVSRVKTFTDNLQRLPRGHKKLQMLRKDVSSLQPFSGQHILVYLTGGFETFLKRLKSFERESFIVYGAGMEGVDGHLTFKAFSKAGFLNDLASCKAVMATAGFTLMAESFYLRKPYLALLMRGQFEQEINGVFMARLRYGINLRRANSEAIGNFLYRIPDFAENLKTYQAEDNGAIKARLAELLDENCALARDFYLRRRR